MSRPPVPSRTTIGAALLLIFGLIGVALPSDAATAPKVGTKCTKLGVKQTAAGKQFVCTRVAGRLVWKLASKPISAPTTTTASPTPTSSTPTSTPSTTPTSNLRYSIYNGGPGRTQVTSVEVPAGISVGTGNIRIWVYDPEDPKRALGSNGIFRKPSDSNWEFVAINRDGGYSGNWPAGEYEIDTVEPSNMGIKYERRRYSVSVDAQGLAKVAGLAPNAQGIYTLTINLRDKASDFSPENPCQLSGPSDGALNVGFPRRSDRLPTVGVVRALIVPVSAKDLPGNGTPYELYRPLAEGVHDFYHRMSRGNLSFDFSVLNEWVSLGDSAKQYNLGSWNGGNPGGYYLAAVNAADPYVDYSRFDIVYFMSPTNVPSQYIAYGPAFPMRVQTADGVLKNGTISGADAYMSLKGAMWKWAAHETGHLFGIYDLYTISPQAATYGSWDLMSLNWSIKAIELNAWNRFTQGWLDRSQYVCATSDQITTAAPLTSQLISMTSQGAGTKAMFVKLSASKVMVIESRRDGGFDNLPSYEEGVLVYTVDMTIPSIQGGFKTQRRTGSTAPDFSDALLRTGDSIQVEGFTVTVLSAGLTSEVRIQRN